VDEREEHQLRAARTQSLYREVNEQIERVHVQLGPGGHEYDVIRRRSEHPSSAHSQMTSGTSTTSSASARTTGARSACG
jgi:hypothetical protein